MSRSISARSSSSPAGRPSTTHVSPGPWDSPAVITRSVTARILRGSGSALGGEAPGGGHGGARRAGDGRLPRLAAELVHRARPAVVAVAERALGGRAGVEDLAPRCGDLDTAGAGLGGRRRRAGVDVDEVELELRPGVVRL